MKLSVHNFNQCIKYGNLNNMKWLKSNGYPWNLFTYII